MRSRTIGRALALTIAMTLAADAPFISFKASAAQNNGEPNWEGKFRAILMKEGQADSIKERMLKLSAEPHHVGSAADKSNAEWIRDQMKSWGLDATIEEFDVLFATPKERGLGLAGPERYQ